eukprot:1792430-Alexandrium_andersonii.AAC.1
MDSGSTGRVWSCAGVVCGHSTAQPPIQTMGLLESILDPPPPYPRLGGKVMGPERRMTELLLSSGAH